MIRLPNCPLYSPFFSFLLHSFPPFFTSLLLLVSSPPSSSFLFLLSSPLGLFKPITSHTVSDIDLTKRNLSTSYPPFSDVVDFITQTSNTDDDERTTTPWQEPQALKVPILVRCDRTNQNTSVFEVKNQKPLSDCEYLRIQNQVSRYCEGTNRPVLVPTPSSPFFSVSRRFEDDLSLMLEQNMSNNQVNNQKNGGEQEKAMDNSYNSRPNNNNFQNNHTNNNNNNNNNQNQNNNNHINNINNNNHNHNQNNNNSLNEEYRTSYPSSTTTFSGSFAIDNGDYSLLDDGDDCDLLSYFGLKSSHWSSEENSEENTDTGSDTEVLIFSEEKYF